MKAFLILASWEEAVTLHCKEKIVNLKTLDCACEVLLLRKLIQNGLVE